MVAWMSAGAASRGIQGACVRDQMQQVFSIDRRKWSCMGATNPWLLQPSMDCSQGGCRDAPTAVRKCEFRGPARDRTVTAIENPRRTLPQARTSPGHFRLRFSISCSVRAPAGPRKSGRYTAGPFNPFRATFQYTGTGLNIVYERALSANPRSSHHSYVHPRHNARSHKLAHAHRALVRSHEDAGRGPRDRPRGGTTTWSLRARTCGRNARSRVAHAPST